MITNIAIDGPAGAGKSTIARKVARALSFIYVDTGAMYRAMALYLLRKNVPADDGEGLARACRDARITIVYEDGEQKVLLDGEDVTPLLRSEAVGKMASASSANPMVREKLVELQREMAQTNSVVMDGRDIGTVVLPGADVKIYLTASSFTRAQRRYQELIQKGEPASLEKIQNDIEQRDYQDMHRECSPLRQAEDAVLVDSSHLTIQEVADVILGIYKEKTGNTWK